MNITALQQTLAWFSLPPILLLLTPFNVNLKRQSIDLTLYELFLECSLIRAQTFIPIFYSNILTSTSDQKRSYYKRCDS